MADGDPIGGGDGLPEPKERQRYGKLPGLSIRQTYRLITAIPVIQLAICFLLFIAAMTDTYVFLHKYLQNFMGFSLLTGLYYWYTARFIGSCGGAIVSIYTLIALNLINILHIAFDFDYYGVYGIATTGVGLVVSLAALRK